MTLQLSDKCTVLCLLWSSELLHSMDKIIHRISSMQHKSCDSREPKHTFYIKLQGLVQYFFQDYGSEFSLAGFKT